MGLPISHRRNQRAFNRAYVSHKTKKFAIHQRRQAEFAAAAFGQFAQVVQHAAEQNAPPIKKEALN